MAGAPVSEDYPERSVDGVPLRPLNWEEDLHVDAADRVYWRGQRLATELRLTRLQSVLVGAAALATVVGAVAAVFQAIAAWCA